LRSAPWPAILAGVVLLGVGPACEEHLPEYVDPTDLFESRIDAKVVYRSDAIAIDVTNVLVNRFDETLDDVVAVDGWITVVLASDPSTVRTFALSASQLVASNYNPATKRLTVDSGDSLQFRIRYDFFDDAGRDLRAQVMHWRQDPSCEYRMMSTSTSFEVRASVRLFPRTEASVAKPFVAQWCIPMPWVDDKVCPDRVQPGVCP
jgi:hypothetical protein